MPGESGARPVALVTGASAGIGAAFAERLAADGYDLILVARRQDRLAALAGRLHAERGIAADVMALDLAEATSLRSIEQRISAEPRLEMLVNNAGFGAYKPFVELPPDAAEELIRVQVTAVTRLTRAALPGMIALGRGAVINLSSRLAWSATLDAPHLPRRAVYAAAKAYINTFSQIVASELAGTGVRVQALCPGIVRTEFHERQGMDPSRFPAAAVMTPEDVVTGSLAGLRAGEIICVPALEEPSVLSDFQQAERRMFENPSGKLAARYAPSK
jgi:short-subunit dehydrogenase